MSKVDKSISKSYKAIKALNTYMRQISQLYSIKKDGYIACKSLFPGIEFLCHTNSENLELFDGCIIPPNEFSSNIKNFKLTGMNIIRDETSVKISSTDGDYSINILNSDNDMSTYYRHMIKFFNSDISYYNIDDVIIEDLASGGVVNVIVDNSPVIFTKQLTPIVKMNSELSIAKVEDSDNVNKYILKTVNDDFTLYTLFAALNIKGNI